MSFFGAFINIRRQVALFQFVSHFHPQKGAGRVARDVFVILHDMINQIRIVIDQIGQDVEIVIVDDRVDFLVQWPQDFADQGPDFLDVSKGTGCSDFRN